MSKRALNHTFLGITFSVLLFTMSGIRCLEAQSTAGTILGTVRDNSGAVVPGIPVVAVRGETNFERKTTTDSLGNYEFPILDRGTYTISAELGGFKKYVNKDLPLDARQVLRVDINLQLGEISETVSVTAEAPVINTETVTLSETRNERLLNEGPVGTPVMARFGLSEGGVSLYLRHGNSATRYTAGGARTDNVEVTQDGNSMDAEWVGPPYQALQEAKEVTVNASAEQRNAVTVNGITKQGTNVLHGELTGNLNHQALQAFAAGPPGAKRGAQVGTKTFNITAGGPVYIPKLYDGRDRTFFFISAERSPYRDTSYFLTQYIPAANVPTVAMRQGDFSKYLAKTKPGFELRDPINGGTFAGNVIPRSLWNSAAIVGVDKFYPVPNISQIGDPEVPQQNFDLQYNETGSFSQWFWRVDQKISNSNTAGFSYNARPLIETGQHAGWWYLVPTTGRYNADRQVWNYTWYDTHIVNPRIVNEFKFGYYRAHNILGAVNKAETVVGPMGINLGSDRGSYGVIPDFSITGFDRIGGLYDQTDQLYNWLHFRENVSWQITRHSLKMGYDHRFKILDQDNVARAAAGGWNFDGTWTGDAFADFILGLPRSTSRFTPRPVLKARYNEFGLFIQDDFKATQRLTLNLGLRYDRVAPRIDKNDAYYSFNPATGNLVFPSEKSISLINPAFPKTIGRELASQVGFPSKLMDPFVNFSPRIGIAYRLTEKGDAVLRAGYGIYVATASLDSNTFRLLNSGGPFALTETFDNTITNGVPLVTLTNPFPSVQGQVPASFNIGAVAPDIGAPYLQQYNLSVEKQVFGNWGLRMSYVGSKTTGAYYQRNLNRPPASLTPYSAARQVYAGKGFNAINYITRGGTDNYNAMQFQFTHKFGHGLYLDGMFQWVSQIADIEDTGAELGSIIENPYDRRVERAHTTGLDSLDFRTVFIYDLPFGRGKTYLAGSNRVVNAILGGWSMSGRYDQRNGRPQTVVYSGLDASNTNFSGGRASLVPGCDPHLSDGKKGLYLNISCFAVPQPGTFGNVARDIFRKPSSWDFSGAVYKYFPIYRERVKFRLDAVFGNLFNHPTWNAVGNNISTPASFGRLSGQGAFGTRQGQRSIIIQGQIVF
jgi:hypothetical protein